GVLVSTVYTRPQEPWRLMRRIVIAALLTAGMLGALPDQCNEADHWKPRQPGSNCRHTLRPRRKVDLDFYHAPSVKGRHIFNGPGALQPDNTIWRLGADDATVLHTDADLDIGGLAVPKGEYTLYIDLNKGSWKLIVNKQLTDDRRRPDGGINPEGRTTTRPAPA